MGHSWGGTIMTAFAGAHPERVAGLVLVDSGQMDYQDAPGSRTGSPTRTWSRTRSARTIRTTVEDLSAMPRRRFGARLLEGLMEAFRAGLRDEDSIVSSADARVCAE
jgi:pimeloyl-ACP methyl ester carboxylesterase